MAAADTATRKTFSPPETVTIPGDVALEALALLDAYALIRALFADAVLPKEASVHA